MNNVSPLPQGEEGAGEEEYEAVVMEGGDG